MNISKKLARYFKDEVGNRKDLDKEAICKFLTTTDSTTKFKCVEPIIKKLMEPNGKKKIYSHIAELYEIEKNTMCITNKRDHVIHALNTYLLGLYINDKYLNVKVSEFEWKFAALFHDIAYPIEIAASYPDIVYPMTPQEIVESYIKTMENIENSDNFIIVVTSLVPENFEKLTNKKNAIDYMEEKIKNKWKLCVNVQNRYETMILPDGKICHGMFSALTVLHLIDSMYQKHNPKRDKGYKDVGGSDWDQNHFENDVVSACSAIFLHNLDKDAFVKIDKNKAPLPYLLKLCDEFQNWDRPNGEEQGDSPTNYNISIQKNKKTQKKELIFEVNCSDVEDKIKDNIKCLNDTSIIVRLVPKEGTLSNET